MAGYGSDFDTYGSLVLTYGDLGAVTPDPDPDPDPEPTPDPPDTPGDGTGTSTDPAIPEPTGPYRFTPPAGDPIGPISMYGPTIRANPLGTRLLAHFRAIPTSVNVYKLADGTYTQVQPTPSPVNHAAVPNHQRIIHLYRGGTTETVSAVEKLALEAAGYTVDTV
jgi:hypothetical protein